MEVLLKPPRIMYVQKKSVIVSFHDEMNISENIMYGDFFSNLTLIISSLLPLHFYNLNLIDIDGINGYLRKNIKSILKYTELLFKIRFSEKNIINLVFKTNLKDKFQIYPTAGTFFNPPLSDYEKEIVEREINYLPKDLKKLIKRLIIYSNVFKRTVKIRELKNKEEEYLLNKKMDFDTYTVNIFDVSRCVDKERVKVYYNIKVNESNIKLIPVIWCLTTFLEISIPNYNTKFGPGFIEELMRYRESIARKILRENFIEIPENLHEKLCIASNLAAMGMFKLTPLILDDNVEEIYIDGPEKNIYLDHSEWGRCETKISLNENEMRCLATYIKAESGLPLDYASPTIKTDLNTRFFKLRINVDTYPLVDTNYVFIIRKFRREPLTIIDLLRKGTLTIDALTYLLIALFHKRNILVVGEPSSGKTTLINALDMVAPSYWRRISVEEVVESLNLTKYGKHDIKYRVDSFDQDPSSRRRFVETIKLLHRSPNYIFFGELLTPDHVSIFLQSLEAGLHGIQTTHANSPEALIRKWIFHYKLPIQSIGNLDVIVHMKRKLSYNENRRFVYRIVEPIVKDDEKECKIELSDLFIYNEGLKLVKDLKESFVFKKIVKEEHVSIEDLYEEYTSFKQLINQLLEKDGELISIIQAFDKMSTFRA
ncbi:MAG: ATPase, T2SS/T4P/T4SS family [archaeon GBS-70-058]|nr:ATPase, T2SS/T4P/T4SS family [Candidatus Culexarchaeum nevadense]